jgi:hypothetical protein
MQIVFPFFSLWVDVLIWPDIWLALLRFTILAAEMYSICGTWNVSLGRPNTTAFSDESIDLCM